MKVPLFLLLLVKCFPDLQAVGNIQEFFIAAVETSWDYLNTGGEEPAVNQRGVNVPNYIKAVYSEFTDSTFTTQKTKPPWAGIQGPTIRAKVNDRVVVHFKNFATYPFSISPIGIPYWKQSEGASYEDSTSVLEQGDDAVQPGGYYKYIWHIHPNSGPTVTDPECLTYSYSSQVDVVRDFNSGLIGAFLICKSGALKKNHQSKVPEFVLLFAVFDESKSWYRDVGRADKPRKPSNHQQFHTINGYVNSTLTGLKLCKNSPEVSWHLIGLGSTPDIHTIQFQDHTLKVMDHRRVIVAITPMTFTTALLHPYTVGKFQISCGIHSHQRAGMSAFFTVENCPESNELPVEQTPQGGFNKELEENEDYPLDNLFSVVFQSGGPPSVLRSFRSRSKVWVHYISAEEVMWDYSPQDDRLEHTVEQTQRLGQVYKKVAYVEYTDSTFTKRKSESNALIGPELRGEVNDQFRIIFKNMASRPYNIFPNGLADVQPMKQRGRHVDLRSLAVPPGQIMVYLWKVTAEDAPTRADPRCLTRLYQSTVNPERDIASGLVGPLIICKSESLDKRGNVLSSDREKHLVFSIFDENKSWYIDENIRKFTEEHPNIDRNDLHFYNANVMHSVNGFINKRLKFKMCVGDVMLWHVASVGMQSDFLSVYFTGNPFERDGTYGTVLTLFPMTGDTVITEMETEGEWEIGAFDPTLKAQGMNVRYSVFNCERELPLVDTNDYDDEPIPMPRSFRKTNRTVAIQVCQKVSSSTNETHKQITEIQTSADGSEEDVMVCKTKLVPVDEADELDILTEGGIPQDILDQLTMEMSSSNRQKRLVFNENVTEALNDYPSSSSPRTFTEPTTHSEITVNGVVKKKDNKTVGYQDEDEPEAANLANGSSVDLIKKLIEQIGLNTNTDLDPNVNLTERTRREVWEMNISESTKSSEAMSDNDILKDSVLQLDKMVESLDPLKYSHKDVQHLDLSSEYSPSNSLSNQTDQESGLSFEYDDYEDEENKTVQGFTNNIGIRSRGTKFRSYYIAAEEILWDYGIDKPSQLISAREMKRGMRKYLPTYKKVVYRAYHDSRFTKPVIRGELDEHLGIMGPVLKVEVNDVLTVVFKNNASRPYSLHLHGVYDRTMASSAPSGVKLGEEEGPGDPVPPGEERIYNWKITKRQGPSSEDFDCKAGAYYSTVNMEKDINSGLIGPMLICRPGTLKSRVLLQPGVQDLFLLFTVFDEKKSWYLDYNIRKFCTPPCQAKTNDPWFETNNKFAAINGYVAETLPGLVVAQHRISRWHLLNVGSGGQFHAVHFHGIPFSVGKDQEHRQSIFNLYPGVFGTIEMRPGVAGTWLVECTIGDHQLSGMRAKLLVYNPECIQPLGMQSGWIADEQLTDSDHYEDWRAELARLHLSGSINAWIGKNDKSWIQVDLLRRMVIHGIQTQGAKTSFGLKDMFTVTFTISYSLDQKTWKMYKGNRSQSEYKFNGNLDGSKDNENLFSPPIIGRYIRIHPSTYLTQPALRFELLGCDINSCSLPLGMQRGLIPDNRIRASTFQNNWRSSWDPQLARLNQEGSANAWRPKSNNPYEWLEVDFQEVKRVTGIVTQGARSLFRSMMVTEFSISISDDSHSWTMVTKPGTQHDQIFEGNNEYNEEKLNVFDPPLFTRFIRIHPKGWVNSIALRVEFLGCETQQRF